MSIVDFQKQLTIPQPKKEEKNQQQQQTEKLEEVRGVNIMYFALFHIILRSTLRGKRGKSFFNFPSSLLTSYSILFCFYFLFNNNNKKKIANWYFSKKEQQHTKNLYNIQFFHYQICVYYFSSLSPSLYIYIWISI